MMRQICDRRFKFFIIFCGSGASGSIQFETYILLEGFSFQILTPGT